MYIYIKIYIYTFCLCISTLIRWLLINSRQMKLKFKLLDHDPWGCRGSKIAIATGVIAYYTLVNRIYKANWDQMDLSQIALIYIYSRTITYIYLSKTAMFKFQNKMIWSLKFWYPTFKWIQMTYAFIMLRPTAASQQSPHGNTAGSPGSIRARCEVGGKVGFLDEVSCTMYTWKVKT